MYRSRGYREKFVTKFGFARFSSFLPERLSRRTLIRGGAGSALASGLAASAWSAADVRSEGEPADDNEPQLREFILTASELDHELMPGTSVRAWGYNGQVPGPELRVREGDTVRVTLRNDLSVPTTIHWHGVDNTPAMDGPAGLNQAPVDPGQEFVYEFVAKPAGTRWYHSHADPAMQIPMGLYGPLVIEPRVAARAYDREYTLILAELDLELTPDVAAGRAERGPRDRTLRGGELGTDLFLLNGKMHGAVPPIRLAEGERVLIRLINAGHLAHPVHTHGHSFKIVATDGNPVPELAQWTKDTIMVSPAERYDLELLGTNPGVWMVHCHIEHHMANGMMTTIWYDGQVPSGPAAELLDDMAPPATGHAHGEPLATPTPEATAPATASATGGLEIEVRMVDDRFSPREVTVVAGTTVTWINKGRDWHSVASRDAGFDSDKLGPGERFSFRFDQPGEYRYVCKHHGLAGMAGVVIVT